MKEFARKMTAVLMAAIMIISTLPMAVSAEISAAVERIDLNIDAITIGVGQKVKTVKPVAYPAGSATTFTWESADEKIAKVNAKGKITGVKKGSTTVTITASNGVKAELDVKVVKKGKGVTKIALSKKNASVVRGKSVTLKATFTPAKPKNKTIIWKSSDESVATVDNKGKVTGVSVGSATITAISSSGKSASCKVTVTGVKIKKIKLTGKTTMLRNETQQLSAAIKPEGADNQELKWKSSDKKIATVDSNGVVTAKKKGKVTITATAKDGSKVKGTFKITVKKGVYTPAPTAAPTPGVTIAPTTAPTAKPTPSPTPIAGEKKAYINICWIELTGSMPADFDALAWVIEHGAKNYPNGQNMSTIGIAAESYEDFYLAFTEVSSEDPDVIREQVMMMMAAGEISNYEESEDPFATRAVIVVADEVPAGAPYTELEIGSYTKPGTTPTPKPTPSAGNMKAYINKYWVEMTGHLPYDMDALTWIIQNEAMNYGNYISDIGIAAKSCEDFYVAYSVVEPDDPDIREKVMMYMAAGFLTNFEEADDPFSTKAVIVVSDTEPTNNLYTELERGNYKSPEATPTPKPTATPDPIQWTLDSSGTLTISGNGPMDDYGEALYLPPWSASKGSIKSVVIKSGVTSIGDFAFDGCTGLNSVTLPEGMTSIGEWAFEDCISLESIVLPEGLSDIGMYAFSGCSALQSVDLPESLTHIAHSAFDECSLTAITIPDGLTYIDSGAFSGSNPTIYCNVGTNGAVALSNAGHSFIDPANSSYTLKQPTYDSITLEKYIGSEADVIVPSSIKNVPVTALGNSTFSSATGLKSVTIPDSISSIGSSAFANQSGLIIYCHAGTNAAAALDGKTFTDPDYSSFNISQDADGGITIIKYLGSETDVIIPSAIRTAPVTIIDDFAFSGNTTLESIVIPDGVTEIGERAFNGCKGLTELAIPGSVKLVGQWAFAYCDALTDVVIMEGVTEIGTSAFYNCHALTSVSIPGSLITIGVRAFNTYGYAPLTFYCHAGTSGAAALGSYKFVDPDYEDFKIVQATGEDRSLSITVRSYIGTETEVVIPAHIHNVPVTAIGSSVFAQNTGLTSVVIPEGVTEIGHQAFYKCTGLESITIPDSITTVDSTAFSGCTKVSAVYLTGEKAPVFDFGSYFSKSGVTIYCRENTEIAFWAAEAGYTCEYVDSAAPTATPAATATAEPTATPEPTTTPEPTATSEPTTTLEPTTTPAATATVEPIATPEPDVALTPEPTAEPTSTPRPVTAEGLEYEINGDEVTIIGALDSMSGEVIIPETIGDHTITAIGAHAFSDNYEISSIVLPETITAIGDYAFSGCSTLSSVSIPNSNGGAGTLRLPDSVVSIGKYAFTCPDLTRIELGNSIKYIGEGAFDSGSLTHVSCPSMESWLNIEFADASLTEQLYMSGGHLTIGGEEARDIVVPESITAINSYAFYNCTSVTGVTLHENVTSIGKEAFLGCTSLESIVIPESVTDIGGDAFFSCSANFTIYGVAGSYAETFANENGMIFSATTAYAAVRN